MTHSFEFKTIDTCLIHAVSRAIKNKLQGRLIQKPKTYCGTRHPCVNKATWLIRGYFKATFDTIDNLVALVYELDKSRAADESSDRLHSSPSIESSLNLILSKASKTALFGLS